LWEAENRTSLSGRSSFTIEGGVFLTNADQGFNNNRDPN